MGRIGKEFERASTDARQVRQKKRGNRIVYALKTRIFIKTDRYTGVSHDRGRAFADVAFLHLQTVIGAKLWEIHGRNFHKM